MKSLIISIILLLSISGCQESSYRGHNTPSLNSNHYITSSRNNPNSLSNKAIERDKDRKDKLEMSKIKSNTQIELAKINSNNRLQIAQVNANATKEVAQTNSKTEIKTSEIDAITSKANMQNQFYIILALILAVTIGFLLLFINNKKNRDLKNKLYQDQLNHEILLKEREHEERRLIKMLDLVSEGKISPIMEEEIILSLTQPKQKKIEETQVIEEK